MPEACISLTILETKGDYAGIRSYKHAPKSCTLPKPHFHLHQPCHISNPISMPRFQPQPTLIQLGQGCCFGFLPL